MKMQRVRALAPIHGSYPCAMGDADYVQSELIDDGAGKLLKQSVAYKRFTCTIEARRIASAAQVQEEAERKRIAEMIGKEFTPTLSADGRFVIVPADPPFIDLPVAMAEDLRRRELVEFIEVEDAPRTIPKRGLRAA